MYFKPERRVKILDVPDDYAHLRQVHRNGNLEFEFFYKVSPNDVVTNEATIVRIEVFSRTIGHRPLLENTSIGYIDTRQLTRNIRTRSIDIKGVAKQRKKFTVTSRNSDISSRINNETIPQLRANVPPRDVWQNYKTRLEYVPASRVKANADVQPILHHVAHKFVSSCHADTSSYRERPSRLMYDMIVRQGVDPTYIFDLTPRNIPACDAVGGLLRPSCTFEAQDSPASQLLDHFIFPSSACLPPSPCYAPSPSYAPSGCYPPNTNYVPDGSLVAVLVRSPVTQIELSTLLVVPFYSFNYDGDTNMHFFAKFELVDNSTGNVIDMVERPLDISKHRKIFNTPKKPPIVKVTKSDISTRANIEVRQVDPGAKAVKIYKKNVYHASAFIDDYLPIGTFNVRESRRPINIQVDMPRNSTAIYRIVPVGSNDAQGFEFTNVVVKALRYKPIKALSLVAQLTSTGIRIEARRIPQDVVAIEFKGRNLTTFEKEYTNIGGGITLIDDSVRTADYVSVVDRDVNPDNVYEYVAKLIYESGTTEISGNATLEFIKPTPGKVDTVISNVQIANGTKIDVTFDINTTIIDSNIDIVKTLLQKQDIFEQFKDDIKREREFLKSLIAHNIQRVNLTTGDREDFGVVTTTSFSDVALRKNQSIQPLRTGNRYRYEVTALLRTPETMFETLVKDKVDIVTKKKYSFSPAKFLHPITLNRGVIVSSTGLKTRFAKDAMSYGAVGALESLEVSFDAEPVRIIDATASRFDRYLNVINWKLQGSVDAVDHFIIMKESLGIRTLIGKAHSEFENGSCQYIHSVTRRDEGVFSYVIVPVFNNYESGTGVSTNAVVVDAMPVPTPTTTL